MAMALPEDVRADGVDCGVVEDDGIFDGCQGKFCEYIIGIWTESLAGVAGQCGDETVPRSLVGVGAAVEDEAPGSVAFFGEVMPDLYRAPEVILYIPWKEKIDIWGLGLMVGDIRRGIRETPVNSR